MTSIEEKTILTVEAAGVTVTESNVAVIRSRIDRTIAYVKNFCNIDDIPTGLETMVSDMAAGESLCWLASFGLLPAGFDINSALKSVKLGDTDVTFADNADGSANFETMVSRLREGANSDLYRYRRMRWR